MMRKAMSFLLVICLLFALAACSGGEEDELSVEQTEGIIAAVEEVEGDDTTLSPDGSDLEDSEFDHVPEGMAVVPNVVGMEQNAGAELMVSKGLDYMVWWSEENNVNAETYRIVGQSIPAESFVKSGTKVELEIEPVL